MPKHLLKNKIRQTDAVSKTLVNNCCIQEPFGSFIPTTAGGSTAWDAAGEAAKNTANDS